MQFYKKLSSYDKEYIIKFLRMHQSNHPFSKMTKEEWMNEQYTLQEKTLSHFTSPFMDDLTEKFVDMLKSDHHMEYLSSLFDKYKEEFDSHAAFIESYERTGEFDEIEFIKTIKYFDYTYFLLNSIEHDGKLYININIPDDFCRLTKQSGVVYCDLCFTTDEVKDAVEKRFHNNNMRINGLIYSDIMNNIQLIEDAFNKEGFGNLIVVV